MLASLPGEGRMDRFEGIKIFVRVVESGSFSAVARELGTGQPAISKQVAALEERLGAQLLLRTSRSLSLTEAGRDFYESVVPLISDLEAAESRIGSGQASPSGVVRVTAAPGFSHRYVVPKLPSFRARYPKVVVEMLVSARPSNLVERHRPRYSQWRPFGLQSCRAQDRRVRRRCCRIHRVSGTQRRAHAPRRSRPPRRRDFRLTAWTATLDLR